MADLSFQQGLQLLEARTKNTTIIVWVVIVLALPMAIIEFLMAAGAIDFTLPDNNVALLVYGLVSLGWAITFFVSVVFVSMWIYRAHANLFAAGYQGLEYTPGWSVGWFFVPIASLFRRCGNWSMPAKAPATATVRTRPVR